MPLILSSNGGFGREELPRRIAFFKCITCIQGVNSGRRELGLPEAPIHAANR
jgi:hypothetical protein